MVVYAEVKEEDAEKLLKYKKCIFDETPFLSRSSEEYTLTVEEEAEKIKKIIAAENTMTLLAWEHEEIVGCLNLTAYPLSRQKHTAGFGLSVRKKFWHKGIGRQLLTQGIEFFKKSSLHRLELVVLTENERAISLYQSLGFVEEGVLKDYIYQDGEYKDILYMALVKEHQSQKDIKENRL